MAISDMAESYPLQWPTGWQRTPRQTRKRSSFGGRGEGPGLTVAAALGRLHPELRLLGASTVVVSTNIQTRRDGLPYSGAREPDDPGVGVYFRFRGQPQVLACDKWNRVADNIAAIAAHVSAMRGQARWGVGSLEQAFAGYKALAAMGAAKPWWEVLGLKAKPATVDEAKARWVDLIERHHPDRGGNPNQAAEINAAWTAARREFEVQP